MRSWSESATRAAPPRPDIATNARSWFVAGAGTPVVMLHSSLGSKMQWMPLAERLALRYRVLALDLCGYGDSPMPSAGAPFTLDDEVSAVLVRLERLVDPHARVHVVGHSYGGLVALRLAQRMRERVASLSLYEPVVFGVLDDEDADLASIRRLAQHVSTLVASGQRREAVQSFVDFWSGPRAFASMPQSAQDSVARRVDKVPLDFEAAWYWPRSALDLRAIAAPTLLLMGTRSPAIVQRIHARLAAVLADRRLSTLEGGHMAPITDPDRVNPWIEAFLDICDERDCAFAVPSRLRRSIAASGVHREA